MAEEENPFAFSFVFGDEEKTTINNPFNFSLEGLEANGNNNSNVEGSPFSFSDGKEEPKPLAVGTTDEQKPFSFSEGGSFNFVFDVTQLSEAELVDKKKEEKQKKEESDNPYVKMINETTFDSVWSKGTFHYKATFDGCGIPYSPGPDLDVKHFDYGELVSSADFSASSGVVDVGALPAVGSDSDLLDSVFKAAQELGERPKNLLDTTDVEQMSLDLLAHRYVTEPFLTGGQFVVYYQLRVGRWFKFTPGSPEDLMMSDYPPKNLPLYTRTDQKVTLEELGTVARVAFVEHEQTPLLWRHLERISRENPSEVLSPTHFIFLMWASLSNSVRVSSILSKHLDYFAPNTVTKLLRCSLLLYPKVLEREWVFAFRTLLAEHVFQVGGLMETTAGPRVMNNIFNTMMGEDSYQTKLYRLEVLLSQESLLTHLRPHCVVSTIVGFRDEFGFHPGDLETVIATGKSKVGLAPHISFWRVFRVLCWLRFKGFARFKFCEEIDAWLEKNVMTEASGVKTFQILTKKDGPLQILPKNVCDHVIVPFLKSPPFDPVGVVFPGLSSMEAALVARMQRVK